MSTGLIVGLAMLGTALLMFIVVIPRGGEAVGFLRDRDNFQFLYMITIILLLSLGGAVTASNWN